MERFVRLIVAGGVALVVGLWVATVASTWSAGWTAGAALALLGVGGLLLGVGSEIEM